MKLYFGKKVALGMNSFRKEHTCTSTHAEVDAIKKIVNWKNKPKKLDLIAIRISKNGIIGESRPCQHCIKYIANSTVRIIDIYYSTMKGIIKESFNRMIYSENNHMSSGHRFKKRQRIENCCG